MKSGKLYAFIIGVMAVSVAFAAEIAFTNAGGDGDLSKASNWDGGALPGAGVTGVVSVATHGAAYTIGSAASIGGLKFTGVSTKVTISGAGTLTLGAGGLTLDSTGGLDIKAKLGTSTAQTWNFGGGTINSYSTISGNSDLTFRNADYLHFREPPNYGGKVISFVKIKYYEIGAFCNTFETQITPIPDSRLYFMITGNVEVAFSTLFPGKRYINGAWDPNTEWVRRDSTPTTKGFGRLVIDDGYFRPGGVGFSIECGYVRQTGGYYDGTSQWGPFIGDYHAYSPTGYGWGGATAAYYMEGGELAARQIFLGMYYNVRSQPARFVQTGGTVSVGQIQIGAGNQTPSYACSEYIMGGGTLDIGNVRVEQQRALCIPGRSGQGSDSPGVFTQTNGTTKAYKILWSSDKDCLGGTGALVQNNGYGVFELKGGRFELGAGGWSNAATWCKTATNSAYSVKFSGGTFAPQSEQVGRMIWTLPSSADTFTFENTNQYTQVAPVFGEGTLRKTGSGLLTIQDATDFRGKLKVDSGTLSIAGVAPATTDDTGALIWSGDDIAEKNGFVEGGAVENLVSTDGSCTFLRQETPSGSTVAIRDKVTITNDTAFAGHKSMYIHYNYLAIPAASSPLNGATNFTIALVYRSNKGNWTCAENSSWSFQYCSSILGHWNDSTITMSHVRDSNYSKTPRFVFGAIIDGTRRQMFSEMDYNMNDNRSHVAILSYAGNRVNIYADGFRTNYFYETATTPAKMRRWFGKDFYLGGVKETAYTHVNQICSDTRIAELRIYPNRALNNEESYRLGSTLSRKYGVNDGGVMRFSAVGGNLSSTAVPADPAPTGYDWCADDLAEANEDGAEITEWKTRDGTTAVARKSEGSKFATKGPSLVKNAVGGHSSLKFSRTVKTSLGVGGASNPVVNPLLGAKDFSLAVVFRSADRDTPGDGTYGGSVATGGDGIFGMRTYNYATHDCGITWHHHGSLQPAWGYGSNYYVDSLRPFHLYDNLPHVAVLSRDGTNGSYIWMVDGVKISSGTSAANTLTSATQYPLLFGVVTHDTDLGFFEGEILAARVYKRPLSLDETTSLCTYYAAKYGFKLSGQMPMNFDKVTAAGLSATNITIAAGATLRLPSNAINPYTMKSGVTLAGAGTVEGVVRYGEGVVYDLGAELPAIEALQLIGTTLKAAETVADGSSISKVSGTIKVDVSAIAAKMKSTQKILENLEPSVVASGVTFEVVGANPKQVFVQYDPATKLLVVRRRFTSVVVIR